MTISKPVWRVFALVAAVTFFLIAIRGDIYNATSPKALSLSLFGPDVFQFAHPWWLSLHIWLRKSFSILAFAIVGFTANRALAPTARPALRAALLVATYSLAIEYVQRLTTYEPLLESALDVGCGAFGGWLAIVAEPAMRRARL